MKVLDAGPSTEARSSWFNSLSNMCAPLGSCFGRKPRRSKSSSLTTPSISWPLGRTSDQDLLIGQGEKSQSIEHHQPVAEARPVARQLDNEPRTSRLSKEKVSRKSVGSSRAGLSARKRFRSDGSSRSRRLQISAPTDFRHIETASFQFPPPLSHQARPQTQPQSRGRRSSFRPLELSIYVPNNEMSPILPHFEFPTILPPPNPVHLEHRLGDDHEVLRQRSYASIPFHLPRQATGSVSSANYEDEPPTVPLRAAARGRAYTSPDVDAIKARVANAMNEIERLQKKIDDAIERQSLYASSRPSTAHSAVEAMQGLEPMPSIPALPPSAPSFAARLNSEIERPQTAPLGAIAKVNDSSEALEAELQHISTLAFANPESTPPPPPLPLVLRPPLRKKKSFSRVSTWLFPDRNHRRGASLDSVTNNPRPVTGMEGFYQCVQAKEGPERRSFDSVGSVTTWDSDDEHRTVPTTWSPGSTPLTKEDAASLERASMFGLSIRAPPRKSSLGASL